MFYILHFFEKMFIKQDNAQNESFLRVILKKLLLIEFFLLKEKNVIKRF